MSVEMVKIYNKNLPPPGNVADVPNQPDSLAVLCGPDTDWELLPDAPAPEPGLAPQPVQFVPIDPEVRAHYDAMKADELRDLAKRAGLPTTGNKSELIARLTGEAQPNEAEG